MEPSGKFGISGQVGQSRTSRTVFPRKRILYRETREISPIGQISQIGAQVFPKCQCSLCHDCIRNKVSQIGLIGLIGKPDGGAVMAPLRRAGLRGSLLVQGDKSD